MFKSVEFSYSPSPKAKDAEVQKRLNEVKRLIRCNLCTEETVQEMKALRKIFEKGTRLTVSESYMVYFLELEKEMNETTLQRL